MINGVCVQLTNMKEKDWRKSTDKIDTCVKLSAEIPACGESVGSRDWGKPNPEWQNLEEEGSGMGPRGPPPISLLNLNSVSFQ